MNNQNSELINEVEELRERLREAEETLHAIRTGQVDAIVVEAEDGHQLYKLQSADHTYRVFIEKMKEGAVTLNSDEIILYCNSQFAAMIGQPLSKVIGKPIREFIPLPWLSFFEELLIAGWESDSKGEIILENDGHQVPFLFSFTTLDLDESKALSIILTDLTMQKNVEAELKEKNKLLEEARLRSASLNEELELIVRERTKDLFLSREHFKFLADNIPVIVWTARPDGRIDYFNNQWYEYTGLTRIQSLNYRARAALHPNDVESTKEAWKLAVLGQNRFEHEFRMKRAIDGIYRWHLGKCESLRDESGQLIAWFGTLTDIEDQRKQMERKDEFISVASHELKTPLTSLKGYLQLIAGQAGHTPELEHYIGRMNGSIGKLQHLINDLLDVSKIQAGKLEFTRKRIDLSELINYCVENCTLIYSDRVFTKSVSGGVWVNGSVERLEQVIMNLVSNAVKYSGPGKNIHIHLEKNANDAIVSVADKGIGLSDTDQKKIFDRFYRVEDNKFLATGLGMGLYISSEIIKEHNGRIYVTSKLNEGSTFYFSLPCASD